MMGEREATAEGLLSNDQLDASTVVANSTMNRERGVRGVNSYTRELGFDPVEFVADRVAAATHPGPTAAWLDLCCGRGRALIETAALADQARISGQVDLLGVDLVAYFDPVPATCRLTLVSASLSTWSPPPGRRFDLITCVHGLHYVGDKLGLLTRAATWLTEDGVFAANFDFGGIRLTNGQPAGVVLTRALREAGSLCDLRRHRLFLTGHRQFSLDYRYLGADDRAGRNYTGQACVNSHYDPPVGRTARS